MKPSSQRTAKQAAGAERRRDPRPGCVRLRSGFAAHTRRGHGNAGCAENWIGDRCDPASNLFQLWKEVAGQHRLAALSSQEQLLGVHSWRLEV